MTTAAGPEVRIECRTSPSFVDWLARANCALAATTYQAGKLALIGFDGERVALLMRQFDKPMGLAVRGDRLAIATRHEALLFANAPLLARDYLEHDPGRYDALFLPRTSFFTGDLNLHDIAWDDAGGLWLVNTRFSCLARLSSDFSFVPCWQPPFITELAPEDRCHLNGLALRDGQPRYATALGTTNVAGGWRANKLSGGVVLEVPSGEVVAGGLAMPHSPRWHDGQLWVLNSGCGELCRIDLAAGRKEVVCQLPGYLRGLGFHGQYALVGLSQIRERHIFGGMPVAAGRAPLRCGLAVVDLPSGRVVGDLEFTAGCTELFEVQALPGVRRPNVVNLQRDAARQAITAPQFAYWLRASQELPPGTVVDESCGAAAGTN